MCVFVCLCLLLCFVPATFWWLKNITLKTLKFVNKLLDIPHLAVLFECQLLCFWLFVSLFILLFYFTSFYFLLILLLLLFFYFYYFSISWYVCVCDVAAQEANKDTYIIKLFLEPHPYECQMLNVKRVAPRMSGGTRNCIWHYIVLSISSITRACRGYKIYVV